MSDQKGTLIISLDFELIWGVFDKVDLIEKEEYFKNTLEAIPKILELFERYNISCTWAIVGMLLNKDWEEWEKNQPVKIPEYDNTELDPYKFGRRIKGSNSEKYCFAPGLISLISRTRGQEIGTHTYSHYYCKEKGQTINDFKADLEKATQIALAHGIEIKSLVFPRNQFNEEYLKICFQNGIENVRSNPRDWYWRDTENNSLLSKIFRTGDAYFGPKNKSYSFAELNRNVHLPMKQKASRLLRPYSSNRLLNHLRILRIKFEMTSAAKRNQIYHLWWHPHNFGNNTEQNLIDLISILDHFQTLNRKFGFQSKNMRDLNAIVI